jgi:hypothetical protein
VLVEKEGGKWLVDIRSTTEQVVVVLKFTEPPKEEPKSKKRGSNCYWKRGSERKILQKFTVTTSPES